MKKRERVKELTVILCGVLLLMTFHACTKEVPTHEDQIGHEHVASLILDFKGEGLEKTFRFDAPEIGKTPLITNIEGLPAGEYRVVIGFRGRANNDITDEFFVRLKDEHFVYFNPVGTGTFPIINYADDDVTDEKGIKLGKFTKWTLRKGESGVIIHLRHEPNIKKWDVDYADELGGHDDIKAEFKIIVTE